MSNAVTMSDAAPDPEFVTSLLTALHDAVVARYKDPTPQAMWGEPLAALTFAAARQYITDDTPAQNLTDALRVSLDVLAALDTRDEESLPEGYPPVIAEDGSINGEGYVAIEEKNFPLLLNTVLGETFLHAMALADDLRRVAEEWRKNVEVAELIGDELAVTLAVVDKIFQEVGFDRLTIARAWEFAIIMRMKVLNRPDLALLSALHKKMVVPARWLLEDMVAVAGIVCATIDVMRKQIDNFDHFVQQALAENRDVMRKA